MLISVLLCTRNNAKDLKEVLADLASQRTVGGVDYEVLVINNNSSDDTKAVIDSMAPSFGGRLRYFFEARPGKPFCMNLGIRHAAGGIIAFIDDDCLIEDDYIMSIASGFKAAGPDIVFMGGKIVSKWTTQRPLWLTDEFNGPLAILDYGDRPFVIDKHSEQKWLYGANQIFRKEVFSKYGPINERKILSQDLEIIDRLLNAGEKGQYVPFIKVIHKINPRKLDPVFFYKWFYKRGIFGIISKDYEFKFYHVLGIPFWCIKEMFKNIILACVFWFGPKRIIYRCRVCYYAGLIKNHINEFFLRRRGVPVCLKSPS